MDMTMTQRLRLSVRLAAVLAGTLGLLPMVYARQTTIKPATSAPQARTAITQPSVSQQRFQQAVRQSQVSDQLRQNQVEHQLRQQSIEMSRRPAGSATPNDTQVDQAEQAQNQLYDARQRDQVQRYNDAITPQPAPQVTTSPPAKP
jgi:hypothetical protein